MRLFGALFTVVLSVMLCPDCRGEDIACRFLADQAISAQPSKPYEIVPRPFANCWMYVFWGEKVNGSTVYHHSDKSPSQTDITGKPAYTFVADKSYYLYFAGHELSEAQRLRLEKDGDALLLPFLVKEQQALDSKFRVTKEAGGLKAILVYSLPLWISHLQRLEEELKNAKVTDPVVVLSKLRQLFYADDNWDTLIPTKTKPIATFSRKNGQITLNDPISLDTAEAVSITYFRTGLVYELDEDKERKKKLRFDFVSLHDGQMIQIGHVLTGVESAVTPMDNELLERLIYEDVAAATWSGDLAQAVTEAVTYSSGSVPEERDWLKALAEKSPEAELIGDIVGAGNAKTVGDSIQKGTPVSESLETLLTRPDVLSRSAKEFVQRYGFNLTTSEGTQLARIEMKRATNRFAYLWQYKKWPLRNSWVQNYALDLAATRLIGVLHQMEKDLPSVAPTKLVFLDRDFDGLTDVEEVRLGTDKYDPDTDGDGLWDGWEVAQGIPKQGIELPGADPLVRDVFVQVDWMKGVAGNDEKRQALEESLKLVVEAFAKPRAGKYLQKGIRLHLEWSDVGIPDESPLYIKSLFMSTRWDALRSQLFPLEKHLTHRHALLALKLESGVGLAKEQAFVLDASLPDTVTPESRRIIAARFMRQLGSSLGLSTGGLSPGTDAEGKNVDRDTVRFKSNHISVMNDVWEHGVRRQLDTGEIAWILDYQDFDLPVELIEIALDERVGVGIRKSSPETRGWFTTNRGKDPESYLGLEGAIDWNLNKKATDVGIQEDLNGRWWEITHRSTLREWSRLRYKAGSIGSSNLYVNLFQRREWYEEKP